MSRIHPAKVSGFDLEHQFVIADGTICQLCQPFWISKFLGADSPNSHTALRSAGTALLNDHRPEAMLHWREQRGTRDDRHH